MNGSSSGSSGTNSAPPSNGNPKYPMNARSSSGNLGVTSPAVAAGMDGGGNVNVNLGRSGLASGASPSLLLNASNGGGGGGNRNNNHSNAASVNNPAVAAEALTKQQLQDRNVQLALRQQQQLQSNSGVSKEQQAQFAALQQQQQLPPHVLEHLLRLEEQQQQQQMLNNGLLNGGNADPGSLRGILAAGAGAGAGGLNANVNANARQNNGLNPQQLQDMQRQEFLMALSVAQQQQQQSQQQRMMDAKRLQLAQQLGLNGFAGGGVNGNEHLVGSLNGSASQGYAGAGADLSASNLMNNGAGGQGTILDLLQAQLLLNQQQQQQQINSGLGGGGGGLGQSLQQQQKNDVAAIQAQHATASHLLSLSHAGTNQQAGKSQAQNEFFGADQQQQKEEITVDRARGNSISDNKSNDLQGNGNSILSQQQHSIESSLQRPLNPFIQSNNSTEDGTLNALRSSNSRKRGLDGDPISDASIEKELVSLWVSLLMQRPITSNSEEMNDWLQSVLSVSEKVRSQVHKPLTGNDSISVSMTNNDNVQRNRANDVASKATVKSNIDENGKANDGADDSNDSGSGSECRNRIKDEMQSSNVEI